MKMINQNSQFRMVAFAIITLWTAGGASLALAQQPVGPTFPSAAEATQSLFQAVQSNNEQDIAKILGGQTDLTSSGEPGQDKVERELFVQKYQEMHRLGREPDGSVVLYIGAENWPFPIPLVNQNGSWRFDADAGQKEVLFRRIGENELTAVATCLEFVATEKHDGSSADRADSDPASLVAKAASGSGNSDPVLLSGYYFRMVPAAKGKTPGAFTLIAYPAQYRSSGVMTFAVTEKGVVYEKDLGANTSSVASSMAAFHKDATWQAAETTN